jgi:phenylacetate-CoA ligase
MDGTKYWEGDIETMERGKIEALQLERFREVIDKALKTSHYAAKLKEAGISGGGDLRALSDISKLPLTSKQDLREGYPYGMLAVPLDEVVRMHASSGTTGKPTTIYHSRADIASWANLMARCQYSAGARRYDVFQNMTGYGLFTGGLGMHYGAEALGMMTIPTGAGNTLRQFQFMKDFGTTVVHATPSYLLHLAEKMEESGFSRSDFKLRKAFIGAEPHSEDIRRKVEELFGIDAYNSYGLSEMNGPGVAFECEHKRGMHIWEDAYFVELIDPDTLEPVPDGEEGELVLTPLCREATQLIRYRTRDLTRVLVGPCACGRTHKRLARFKGRSDDMLIINGVNVFPSQIEEVIMGMSEIANNYVIVVRKAGAMDKMIVKTEVVERYFSDDARDLNALKRRIEDKLAALITIHPDVELHQRGALPVSEGKAKRVVDERPGQE